MENCQTNTHSKTLLISTPVEVHICNEHHVLVKREGLCCPDGPPFSKMRGIHEHLLKLKARGIKTVGYVETSISMAGWGVAWLAEKIGLKAVIFDPSNPLETQSRMERKNATEITHESHLFLLLKELMFEEPAEKLAIDMYAKILNQSHRSLSSEMSVLWHFVGNKVLWKDNPPMERERKKSCFSYCRRWEKLSWKELCDLYEQFLQWNTRKQNRDRFDVLDYHRKKWKEFSAEVIPIKLTLAKVRFNMGKKILSENYEKSVMLPLGLPFEETVEATAKEYQTVADFHNTVVLSVGSGTVAAGVYRGMQQGRLIGALCRSGSPVKKQKTIENKAGKAYGLLSHVRLSIEDDGYEYTDREDLYAPFPCNPYYDRKAWRWLHDHIHELEQPVLFWNIGGGGEL